MSDDFQYGRGGSRWAIVAVVTLVVAVGLFIALRPPSPTRIADGDIQELVVYCAAGIRKPVEALAAQFEDETGVTVRVEYGSSGELEGKLSLDRDQGKPRADLYIPADAFFAKRAAGKGLVRESLPLARLRLVLAKKPDVVLPVSNLDELLASGKTFVLCNHEAGVGRKTAATLGERYAEVAKRAKTAFPRVPEAASAIKTSAGVDAGFIWNTTAAQYGLEVVEIEELAGAVSTISANVVNSTPHPAAALQLARFLSSPEKGNPEFARFAFEPIPGDPWVERPEIRVFCGGVNRGAVEETIKEFEEREGARVTTEYAGCGTLVTSIKSINAGGAGHFPDAFMTCDASYLKKVAEDFGDPTDVSSTRIVMLVREGNPKDIKQIADLAMQDIAIGTTDREMSALGELSWKIIEDVGIRDKLEQQQSVIVTTPTAHELVLQMLAHKKLDVALVYEANCVNVGDGFEVISVDHPLAKAVQNVAVAKKSTYPMLVGRLLDAIRSAESQSRYTRNRFTWLGKPLE